VNVQQLKLNKSIDHIWSVMQCTQRNNNNHNSINFAKRSQLQFEKLISQNLTRDSIVLK